MCDAPLAEAIVAAIQTEPALDGGTARRYRDDADLRAAMAAGTPEIIGGTARGN